MARAYDNWERLVTATLRQEQLRLIGLSTPSDVSSLASSSSPSSSFTPSPNPVSAFNYSRAWDSHSYTYHQILQATNNLSDSNLIKHGSSGDLFYGVLEGGTRVVIKKLIFLWSRKNPLFITELELRQKISHSGLVPLLGNCLEKGNDKFLVYMYMANKDLSSSLFMAVDTDGGSRLPCLDWRTRLKIATGAAKCLSYLHHECVPSLVHRDIQSSSILLDDKFKVRLGSLSKVCAEEKDIIQNRIAKFLRIPKGCGEGASGASNATCAYDVYCFGIVLLELVTGKLGVSAVNDSNMKDWMASMLANIVPDDEELIVNIADQSLIIDHKHLLTQVWAVAFVAKACLNPKSSKRPQMAHVHSALKHIKSACFTTYGNLKRTVELDSFDHGLAIAKILEGSKIIGSTLRSTSNTPSTGSWIAARNHLERLKRFIQKGKSPLGQI